MSTNSQQLLARLRFRHLQMLDMLEKEGSLRKAAIALHLTQPALSKTLRDLEEMLGLQLYERSSGRLECTPAGRVLVRGARGLIEDTMRLVEDGGAADSARRLQLRIGVPPFIASTLMPAMLARVAAEGWELSIVVHEEWGPSLVEALDAGQIDLFVTMFSQSASVGKEKQRVAEVLFKEHASVIAAANDPLTRPRRLGWGDLLGRSWILPAEPAFLRRAVSAQFLAAGLQPPTPSIESPLSATNIALVAAGLGISAVPRTAMLDAAQLGKIGIVHVDPAPSVPPVQMVYRDRMAIKDAVAIVRDGIRYALDLALPKSRHG